MSAGRIKKSAYESIDNLIQSIGSETQLGRIGTHSAKLNAVAMTVLAFHGAGTEMMAEVNVRKQLQDKLTVLITAMMLRVDETDDDDEARIYSNALEAASRTVLALQGKRGF